MSSVFHPRELDNLQNDNSNNPIPKRIINVLLLGRTGSGKSTLGNVITASNQFEEGYYASSQTKRYKGYSVEHGEVIYNIVDTVGIGDTDLSDQEVMYRIADACYELRDGIHQVLFVVSERFTRAEIQAYNLFRTVIFDQDICNFTTLVRTRFPRFRNPEDCASDIAAMQNISEELNKLVRSFSKILHVSNPPEEEEPETESRSASQEILRLHLRNCREVYNPRSQQEIVESIQSFKTEEEKLQLEINTMAKMAQELKEQIEKSSATLAIKEAEIRDMQLSNAIQEEKIALVRKEAELQRKAHEQEMKRNAEHVQLLQQQQQNLHAQIANSASQVIYRRNPNLFGALGHAVASPVRTVRKTFKRWGF